MWLVNTETRQLRSFTSINLPLYCVLSHRWGDDEISYQDLKAGTYDKRSTGYRKVSGTCRLAASLGYEWVWIDTCCIDKSSSSHLDEELNSMFDRYAKAGLCVAYLNDVLVRDVQSLDLFEVNRELSRLRFAEAHTSSGSFQSSEWFRRGWTLQELIASKQVQFYNCDWDLLGSKTQLAELISRITGIGEKYLTSYSRYKEAPVAQRLSWASRRTTTLPEDIAYSLLGLLEVRMPLHYGEGEERAFSRLQQAIINGSPDQSIFAWRLKYSRGGYAAYGVLAHSPKDFEKSNTIEQKPRSPYYTLQYSYVNGDIQFSQFVNGKEKQEQKDREELLTLACCDRSRPNYFISISIHQVNGLWYRTRCEEWKVMSGERASEVPQRGLGHRRNFRCAATPGMHYDQKRLHEAAAAERWNPKHGNHSDRSNVLIIGAICASVWGAAKLQSRREKRQNEYERRIRRLTHRLDRLEASRKELEDRSNDQRIGESDEIALHQNQP